MTHFVLHIENDDASDYTIAVITDSAVNAIPAAVRNGLFANPTDVYKVDKIVKINADEYTRIIEGYNFTRTIIAVEHYELELHAISLTCKIPHPNFDLLKAVKAAAKDFCLSNEGKNIYSGNCHAFNWGDLVTYIDDDCCKKYGFHIIHRDSVDEVRDANEQLVIESEIFPDD